MYYPQKVNRYWLLVIGYWLLHPVTSNQHPASSIQYPAYRFGIADCGFQIEIISTVNRLKDLRSTEQ